MLVTEKVSFGGSFSVAFSAHTGIGTLPLVYYGTKEQKDKYLEKITTGEWIAAYCLTEPGSGSDALGAQASAVLSEDGKYYILNGTKQFVITSYSIHYTKLYEGGRAALDAQLLLFLTDNESLEGALDQERGEMFLVDLGKDSIKVRKIV